MPTHQYRRIAHFSCGAASAVATKLSNPDLIWYAATGGEDPDNERFLRDCERWFKKPVEILKSKKYVDTWAVWEKLNYIVGIGGAPCTRELKIAPQKYLTRMSDIHIYGFTSDLEDTQRAKALREHNPEMSIEMPLIDLGISKHGCLSLLYKAGITPPRTYLMGFPHANCIPCCKATKAEYWALVRQHYPEQFDRMARLSRKLGVRLTVLSGKRAFIDEIPNGHPVTNPTMPACDALCQLIDDDLLK